MALPLNPANSHSDAHLDALDVVAPLLVALCGSMGWPPTFTLLVWVLAAAFAWADGRTHLLLMLSIAAMLLGPAGRMPWVVLGVPITLAKLSVLPLLWHVGPRGLARAIRTHRVVLGGLLGLLVVMWANALWLGLPGVGPLFAVSVSLNALFLLIVLALPKRAILASVRGSALFFAALLLISLPEGWPGARSTAVDSAWLHRSQGPSGHPNAWAANVLVLSALLLPALARRTAVNDAARAVMMACVPVIIVQTGSRAALAAMMVVGLWVVWSNRARPQLLLSSMVVAVVLLLTLTDIDGMARRLMVIVEPRQEIELGHGSLVTRRSLAYASWELFWGHPLTGIGLGRFPPAAAAIRGREVLLMPHNTYLQVFVETGLVGIGAFASVCALVLRASQSVSAQAWSAVSRSAVAALVAGAMLAAAGDHLTFTPIWLAAGLLLAFRSTSPVGLDVPLGDSKWNVLQSSVLDT